MSFVQPSKVPEATLGFWVVKIAATTLGETGGDALSMSAVQVTGSPNHRESGSLKESV